MPSHLKHIDFQVPNWGEFVNPPLVRSGYRSEVLADNPLAYYRMGESSGSQMDDASSNVNHGTYFNTPTLSQTGALAFDDNTSVAFNGTNEYVTGPFLFDLSATDWTISLWVYVQSIGSGSTFAFVSQQDGTGTGRTIISFRDNAGDIFSCFLGGANRDSGFAASLQTWHHVAMTWNKTSKLLSWFIDGVARNTHPSVAIESATGSMVFAANKAATTFFNGRLDEISIYNTEYPLARFQTLYSVGTNG